ncbi:alpha/beta hydrolase [Alteromonas sp. CYL-A6]|uniref:alpha/beta hydrolase n=1 Tax=Alteromonas nitratireducens TaxID=3390813 RepID=UPI0034BE964C
MFHRFLLLTALVASVALSGCAINVTPSTFISQDAEQTPVDTTSLHASANQDETLLGITRVKLVNSHGLLLRGIALSYPDAIANIVIYPGNGMTISKANKFLHRFSKLPANVLIVDYQGMGASEKASRITIDALKEDALLVFDHAKEVFHNDNPVLLHGVSMGSLIAPYVASQRKVDGLVLDGAIDSVPDLVNNLVPVWSKLFTRISVSPELNTIDNSECIAAYRGPLLILAGEEDDMTPVAASERLLAESPSEFKQLVRVPEATHAMAMKYDITIAAYQAFISALTTDR